MLGLLGLLFGPYRQTISLSEMSLNFQQTVLWCIPQQGTIHETFIFCGLRGSPFAEISIDSA
jgi:hypothetical protein